MYLDHLTRADRLQAELALTRLAGAMEQYYLEHDTYEGASLSQLGMPANIGPNHYQLDIASATSQGYSLDAIPVNLQAKRDVACGTLSFNSSGQKKVSGTAGLNNCW